MNVRDRGLGTVFVRVAGALVLGFASVRTVVYAWSATLFERLFPGDAEGLESYELDAYDLREKTSALLDFANRVGTGSTIVGDAAVALTLAAAAWHARALRLPAGVAALCSAITTAAWIRVLGHTFSASPPEPGSTSAWSHAANLAPIVGLGAAIVLVVTLTRSLAPARRKAANACMVVAALAVAVHLQGWLMPEAMHEAPWLTTRVPLLRLRVVSAIHVGAMFGLGGGLWLAGGQPDQERRHNLAAVRGLRWARKMIGWRVAVGVGTAVLAIAGMIAMQRAQQAALFGIGPHPQTTPWMLRVAPWLGHLEIALGVVLVVGLGMAVLQERSKKAAGLVAVGALLLLGVTMGSLGLNLALHQAIRGLETGSPWLGGWSSWGGNALEQYAKVTAELEPTLRWIGFTGMACALLGLITLLQATSGGSPQRAIRFAVMAFLFTFGWTHGRDELATLGSGVLLAAPLVLGAAIWMLLDLTTFLREVADALEAEPVAKKQEASGMEELRDAQRPDG